MGNIEVLTSITRTADIGYDYKNELFVDYLSGCCHEEIIEVQPKFKKFIDYHNKKPSTYLLKQLKILIKHNNRVKEILGDGYVL